VITCPFSEAVFRHLLRTAATAAAPDSLVAKTAPTPSTQLVRQIPRKNRVAYKCISPRLPHVRPARPGTAPPAQHPGRRQASRECGPYARISHEMLTTCCQGQPPSRRENNWHLYADEMLLRLPTSGRQGFHEFCFRASTLDWTRRGCGPARTPARSDGRIAAARDDAGEEAAAAGVLLPCCNSSHPVWPRRDRQAAQVQLIRPSLTHPPIRFNSRPGLIADSEHRAAASSPDRVARRASSAGGLSTSTPTMLGGALAGAAPGQPAGSWKKRRAGAAVELPYSFSALQVLIEGACDSETMEILREKMEYYSTYKVAVTRTVSDNKRVFRCSGCSASSPHGMGDIRKHILGVHAKTACLHASRLSRDDNRLLPDPLLIQLARLKWKGTVGPNEEKTRQGRRPPPRPCRLFRLQLPFPPPAAASTASYDAAFPSMVPLRPARARLSSVSPASATGSVAASPNKGLRIKIKTTGAGSDQELVTSVASADEPGEDAEDSTSSSAGVPPEMQCSSDRPQIPTTCFQAAAAGQVPVHLQLVRVRLPQCWRQSGATSCATTCAFPGHKCSVCGKLYAVRNHVFRHHLLEHPQREFHPAAQYSAYRYAMNRVDVKPSTEEELAMRKEDEEEEEAETEAQEDDEEQDDEEEGAETAAAQPASVMVNGKELLLMPDSLDRAWTRRLWPSAGCTTWACSRTTATCGRRSYWSREVLDTHFTEAHPATGQRRRPPQAYRDAIQDCRFEPRAGNDSVAAADKAMRLAGDITACC
uniref:C2H2-type domain-containing protein n=1 Tax=Macrostomum lignano TaxID=282301 RepID=A0A1I8FQ97_9PLAT